MVGIVLFGLEIDYDGGGGLVDFGVELGVSNGLGCYKGNFCDVLG